MGVKEVVDSFFRKETNINHILYDPADVDINDDTNDLRLEFDIMKENPNGGGRLYDKIADGAGHYRECPWCVVEVTASDVQKAKAQIKSTLNHIYRNENEVRKIAIILDENRWNDRLGSKHYRIDGDLLFKRRENNNETITIKNNEDEIRFDLYCYLVDFERYGLE